MGSMATPINTNTNDNSIVFLCKFLEIFPEIKLGKKNLKIIDGKIVNTEIICNVNE